MDFTDGNIPLVYTKRNIVGKEAIKKKANKYDDMSFLQIKLVTNLNSLIKFVDKSICNI